MHVRYKSLYVSQPSVLKKTTTREMIKFYIVRRRTRTTAANFSIFIWNWTLALHLQLEQVLRPVGVLNRSRQLRNSKTRDKFNFYQAFSSVLLEPPGTRSLLLLQTAPEESPATTSLTRRCSYSPIITRFLFPVKICTNSVGIFVVSIYFLRPFNCKHIISIFLNSL